MSSIIRGRSTRWYLARIMLMNKGISIFIINCKDLQNQLQRLTAGSYSRPGEMGSLECGRPNIQRRTMISFILLQLMGLPVKQELQMVLRLNQEAYKHKWFLYSRWMNTQTGLTNWSISENVMQFCLARTIHRSSYGRSPTTQTGWTRPRPISLSNKCQKVTWVMWTSRWS